MERDGSVTCRNVGRRHDATGATAQWLSPQGSGSSYPPAKRCGGVPWLTSCRVVEGTWWDRVGLAGIRALGSWREPPWTQSDRPPGPYHHGPCLPLPFSNINSILPLRWPSVYLLIIIMRVAVSPRGPGFPPLLQQRAISSPFPRVSWLGVSFRRECFAVYRLFMDS